MTSRRSAGRPQRTFDGVVLLRKPEGVTSRDVVNEAARALGRRDVGHAGTLDPFATGLLQLVVGRGTKLVPYLHEWRKEYRAVAELGAGTDTLDVTGRVVERSALPADAGDRLGVAAAGLVGTLQQAPPMYSAVRVGGVRLHELARGGMHVDRAPRPVTVHEIEILAWEPPRVTFRVVCSSGTYIRVLAESLGALLGVPAHLAALERTAVGPHRVADASPLEEIASDADPRRTAWIPLADVLSDWPVWSVDPDGVRDLAHGRIPAAYRTDLDPVAFPARFRVLGPSGDLIALVAWRSPDEPPAFLRGFPPPEGR